MATKSTAKITRSEALHFITDVLYEVDDETLAETVEKFNDYLLQQGDFDNSLGFHNFEIVPN